MRAARIGAIAAIVILAPAALPACLLGYAPGAYVDVVLRAAPRSTTSAEGARITAMQGEIHLGAVSLLPCEGPAPMAHVFSFGPSVARAHGGTALGTLLPGVWPIAPEAVPIGRIPVAGGAYCALSVTIVPTERSEGALDPDETLWLTGRAERGDASSSWRARGPGNLEVTLPLSDPDGAERALSIDAARRTGMVEIGIDWASMIESTPLLDREPSALALDLVARMRHAITARAHGMP